MSKDKKTKEQSTDHPSPVAEQATEEVLSVDNAQDVKKVILDSYREKTGVCPKCGAPLILSHQTRSVMVNHKMTSVTEASIRCSHCDWHRVAKNREDHVVPALAPKSEQPSPINPTTVEERYLPRQFVGTILDPAVTERLRLEAIARSGMFFGNPMFGSIFDPLGFHAAFPFPF